MKADVVITIALLRGKGDERFAIAITGGDIRRPCRSEREEGVGGHLEPRGAAVRHPQGKEHHPGGKSQVTGAAVSAEGTPSIRKR